MSRINPREVQIGDSLTVSDSDSRYDGTDGRALQVFDDHIKVELDVWVGCGKLTRDFDIDQLERRE